MSKICKTEEEFYEMEREYRRETGNFFPKGITAEEAVLILQDHFLGNIDGEIAYPASTEQIYAEIVSAVLKRYPAGKIRRIRRR